MEYTTRGGGGAGGRGGGGRVVSHVLQGEVGMTGSDDL